MRIGVAHEPGSRDGYAHERDSLRLESRQNVHLVTRCDTTTAGPPTFPFPMLDRAFANDMASIPCPPLMRVALTWMAGSK